MRARLEGGRARLEDGRTRIKDATVRRLRRRATGLTRVPLPPSRLIKRPTEVVGFGMIARSSTTLTLSVHRFALSCVGIWPVQERSLFTNLRWIVALFLEVSAVKLIAYSYFSTSRRLCLFKFRQRESILRHAPSLENFNFVNLFSVDVRCDL